jgi:hypothetical protein
VRRLAEWLLAGFAIAFAIACTIIACLIGVGGCKKVSDPVVADSTYVRGHLGACVHSRVRGPEPPRIILESHAP